jgi:single-strand DNA-binding protein
MNVFIVNGNLTKDPVVRQAGGKSVVNFSIAHNPPFKKPGSDEWQDAIFFDCDLWGDRADKFAEQYVKGDSVLVKGSLKEDKWIKDGTEYSKYKISVEHAERLHKPAKGDRAPAKDSSEPEEEAPKKSTSTKKPGTVKAAPPANDDIPF